MNCTGCGQPIDQERLEVLPHTTTCVGCSKEPKVIGFMEYAHKTAGYVVFVREDDTESLRRAKRAYRRAR